LSSHFLLFLTFTMSTFLNSRLFGSGGKLFPGGIKASLSRGGRVYLERYVYTNSVTPLFHFIAYGSAFGYMQKYGHLGKYSKHYEFH
jgi:hypothetical protein